MCVISNFDVLRIFAEKISAIEFSKERMRYAPTLTIVTALYIGGDS